MKLIVGLGNPGLKYQNTRHNIGFLIIDDLIRRWNATGPVSREKGQVFQAQVKDESVLLVKPQTYMNLSGQCVGPLFFFYRCEPADLMIIHDELDLPPAQFRMKTGGGTGGHNGLKSIDEALGEKNQNYHRIRLGIGHPSKLGLPLSPADYVLQRFSEEEKKNLEVLANEVADSIQLIMSGKISVAMNLYHKKK